MLTKMEENGLYEGFIVSWNRTRVSILQVADNTIFFFVASLDFLQNLKLIFLVFRQFPGLKINLEKNTLFGINVIQYLVSRLASTLYCRVSKWPLSYLNLPLGRNSKIIGSWDHVVNRVLRRLDGWKKVFLSMVERITLIQSCLSHIFSYFLSLFKIPTLVALKIEKMQRGFLRSRFREEKKDHLISWDVVCRPKEFGGLGIGKISLRNHALLGK